VGNAAFHNDMLYSAIRSTGGCGGGVQWGPDAKCVLLLWNKKSNNYYIINYPHIYIIFIIITVYHIPQSIFNFFPVVSHSLFLLSLVSFFVWKIQIQKRAPTVQGRLVT
jgi:hypothetical protein